MIEVQPTISFSANPEVLRAFRKHGFDREFNEFIESLQSRAVMLAIMALGQKDDTISRWLGGRAQELLEIVGAFKERVGLMDAAEAEGQGTESQVPWPAEGGEA